MLVFDNLLGMCKPLQELDNASIHELKIDCFLSYGFNHRPDFSLFSFDFISAFGIETIEVWLEIVKRPARFVVFAASISSLKGKHRLLSNLLKKWELPNALGIGRQRAVKSARRNFYAFLNIEQGQQND